MSAARSIRVSAIALIAAISSSTSARDIPTNGRAQAAECGRASCGRELVFFGTRADGPGTGIAAARLNWKTGRLAALGIAGTASHPTFLLASPHRSILYAVREAGNDGATEGGLVSFGVDQATGRLSPISAVGSGGGGPTHLAIASRVLPPAILVANYGTGDISVVPLGEAGRLGTVASRQKDIGSGPTPRQKSAHPHGIAVDPTGRYALVSDLGADRVFVYGYDPVTHALSPAEPASVAVPPGAGLRHIIFHSSGRLVFANAEFTGDVFVFGWNAAAGRLTMLGRVPTRAARYVGDLSSAEIALSADGRYLYVSNRGADELLVYAVDARTGDMSLVQRLPSGGKDPASFAIDPVTGRWLLVADEGSNRVAVFARDPATGRLTNAGADLAVADPTSVAFLLR